MPYKGIQRNGRVEIAVASESLNLFQQVFVFYGNDRPQAAHRQDWPATLLLIVSGKYKTATVPAYQSNDSVSVLPNLDEVSLPAGGRTDESGTASRIDGRLRNRYSPPCLPVVRAATSMIDKFFRRNYLAF